jgi:hypothetical protein
VLHWPTHPKKLSTIVHAKDEKRIPLPEKLKDSYKILLSKKRENIVQEEEYQHKESDINIFSLEDMKL